CGPAMTTHVGKVGDKSAPVAGDPVQFKRIEVQGDWHPKMGIHFVHTKEQWSEVFRPERKALDIEMKLGKPLPPVPPFPADVDLAKETLIVATGPDVDGSGMELTAATKDSRGLHLHLTEQMHGDGCPQNPPGTPPPMDVATIPGEWRAADIWINRVAA